ncbi:MAG TPA: hypothetical protein VJ783_27305, partial [Pirellulales bacterium]|nr:hypothetical protein [Pirellulales bacterium]
MDQASEKPGALGATGGLSAAPRSTAAPSLALAAAIRRIARLLYNHNPFYVVSTALVLYGLYVSFLGDSQAFQTRALIGGLMGFTL